MKAQSSKFKVQRKFQPAMLRLALWLLIIPLSFELCSLSLALAQPGQPQPRPATQAEVDAGLLTRPYVSPATLRGFTPVATNFTLTFDPDYFRTNGGILTLVTPLGGTNTITISNFNVLSNATFNGPVTYQGPVTYNGPATYNVSNTFNGPITLATNFTLMGDLITNIFQSGAMNPTVGFLPYKSSPTNFGDSPFYRSASNLVQFIDAGGKNAALILGYAKAQTNEVIYPLILQNTSGQGANGVGVYARTTNDLNLGALQFIKGYAWPNDGSTHASTIRFFTAAENNLFNDAFDIIDETGLVGGSYHVRLGGSSQWWTGTNSPEGVVTSPPGAYYLNTLGGAGTTLYVKEDGFGNTGWVGVGAGGGGGSHGGTSIWTNQSGLYSPTEANAQSLQFGTNTTNSASRSIALGANNLLFQLSHNATISGGYGNIIESNSPNSVIAGGTNNLIQKTNWASTISGGQFHSIGYFTTGGFIGGGESHILDADADYGFVGGGQQNRVRDNYGTIAGGIGNDVQQLYGFIGGGANNLTTRGDWQVVAGGEQNVVRGDHAGILAGANNTMSAAADGVDGDSSVLVGGGRNAIGVSGIAGAAYAFLGGGQSNLVMDAANHSFLGGGAFNQVGGGGNAVVGNFLGGGFNNLTGDQTDYAVIGGGRRNTVSTSADFGQIFGGQSNLVTATHGIVIAGYDSRVTATNAIAIGSTTTNDVANSVAISVVAFPNVASFGLLSSRWQMANSTNAISVLPDATNHVIFVEITATATNKWAIPAKRL